MAKGQQRRNKEVRKPKKDTSGPKPISQSAVMPTKVTAVQERGKKARHAK